MEEDMPSPLDHLPPSLPCRNCQMCTAFMTRGGAVKAFCSVMHLLSYDSEEAASSALTSCSSQVPQEA